MKDELIAIKICATSILNLAKKITDNASNSEPDKMRSSIEFTYGKALEIERISKEILSDTSSGFAEKPRKPSTYFSAESNHSTVEFLSDSIVKVVIETPPILKNSASAKIEYQRKYCAEIQKAILDKKPHSYPVFKEFYFIFIQYCDTAKKKINAYFDNDNLSIKPIIDAMVPLICIDDCAQLCSNIYLCEEDTDERVEVFLVKKGHLSEWQRLKPELKFCQEFHP